MSVVFLHSFFCISPSSSPSTLPPPTFFVIVTTIIIIIIIIMIIITHLYIPPASINYFFHPCSAFPVVPVWLSRFPSTFDLSLVAAAARPMVVHNHGPPPGHALLECSLFAPPLPCPTPWGEYHCASFDPSFPIITPFLHSVILRRTLFASSPSSTSPSSSPLIGSHLFIYLTFLWLGGFPTVPRRSGC